MATDDKEPRSVMSRNKGDGQVVTGARRIKHRNFPSVHRETWPMNTDSSQDLAHPAQATKATKKKRTPKSPKPIKEHQQPVSRIKVPASTTRIAAAVAGAAASSSNAGCYSGSGAGC